MKSAVCVTLFAILAGAMAQGFIGGDDFDDGFFDDDNGFGRGIIGGGIIGGGGVIGGGAIGGGLIGGGVIGGAPTYIQHVPIVKGAAPWCKKHMVMPAYKHVLPAQAVYNTKASYPVGHVGGVSNYHSVGSAYPDVHSGSYGGQFVSNGMYSNGYSGMGMSGMGMSGMGMSGMGSYNGAVGNGMYQQQYY